MLNCYNIIGDEEKKHFTYKMVTLGHVKAFLPESNSITMYLERIDLLITSNKVEEDRKSAVLLCSVECSTTKSTDTCHASEKII